MSVRSTAASIASAIALAAVLDAAAGSFAPAHAVDTAAVEACHQEILRAIAGVVRGRVSHMARCLKNGNFDDACIETDSHAAVHENELRNHIAGASSSCTEAVASGATVADFGPLACDDEWEGCAAEVPAIATLDDLAECFVCQQRGYDLFVRSMLGMPRAAPTDPREKSCTRGLFGITGNTFRKSLYDDMRCAAAGGAKPFDCAVDASDESRFGASLAKIPRSAARCGIDDGEAPGALANLCNGTATDAAGLAACFDGIARCLACRTANSALGQTEDCIAFSGLADCDGAF